MAAGAHSLLIVAVLVVLRILNPRTPEAEQADLCESEVSLGYPETFCPAPIQKTSDKKKSSVCWAFVMVLHISWHRETSELEMSARETSNSRSKPCCAFPCRPAGRVVCVLPCYGTRVEKEVSCVVVQPVSVLCRQTLYVCIVCTSNSLKRHMSHGVVSSSNWF